MTARLDGWNIGRGLRVALIAQCIIAALLVVADLNGRLSWPGTGTEALPSGPVAPGDQVRHYEPRAPRPTYVRPSTDPGIALPADLPERLEFSVVQADGFGDVLLLNGTIDKGDTVRFEGFVEGLETVPETIVLNSPGGLVEEALTIGRSVRDRGFDTAVPAGMFCVSSCPYLLAAGVERTVSRSGVVGLHQHYYDAPRFLPVIFAVEDIQRGQGRTMQYLIDMGVSAELLLYSLNTSPADIYVLVEEELLETELATGMSD